MRKIWILVSPAVVAILVVASIPMSGASSEPERFRAVLNGAQEQPGAISTDATGLAKIEIDGNTVSFEVVVVGLDEDAIGAHIHTIGFNTTLNGPIRLTFCGFGPPPNPACGTGDGRIARGEGTVSNATLEAIRRGRAYVNVHTPKFPGGKIRGWLTPKD